MAVSLHSRTISDPVQMGSYRPEEVTFLLKDLSQLALEQGTEDREEAIQSGTHYSEMLPIEYEPSPEYIQLFHRALESSASKVALAVAVVAEKIVRRKGLNTVLVSLARAGTPVGVLIKRYILQKYGVELPHYSISIIRGKGIDENALVYIVRRHPESALQFVDGWTGKGAIRKVLIDGCQQFNAMYGTSLDDELAVLADPGHCTPIFGTREDFLIPSACLNATVSGLISRTVLRDDLIGPHDFHGAKFYKEWADSDKTNLFVDTVAAYFTQVSAQAQSEVSNDDQSSQASVVTWQGMKSIEQIQQQYAIKNINLIKPGVGETTRVLLRRVPWKILVDRLDNPHLQHILLLAEERNVPIEQFEGMTYSCCGLIKPLKEE
ncbi:cysteine protease StiP family protein [Paenibacillus sp. 481]|uniref:cysteine protease StiP family protein n=1 Tax=Paenibacillus sp. 481 TaxID=2835869 RepID=UPI001E41D6D0|nr:cysteine protease StiP family protein [Paenibacillus sp. 481]UHA74799.1 cysteine protease StiP family protein [Paenibacillus sp. 481]